jgi:polyhydroxyalkanoate synthesis repressor PhaR
MAKEQPGAGGESAAGHPVIIKKYANRRLYNTASSTYVTLEDLARMVREGSDFVVYDAKTNEDITRSVLTQIIVEEEAKGQNLLPVSFLRQLIALYGDSLQTLVPKYLEHSMASFTQNQARMREYINKALEGVFPFGSLEEMSRKNMEFLDKTFRMFSPFPTGQRPPPGGAPESKPVEKAPGEEALSEMQRKIEALEKQIQSLKK